MQSSGRSRLQGSPSWGCSCTSTVERACWRRRQQPVLGQLSCIWFRHCLPKKRKSSAGWVGGWVWGKSEADTVHPEEDGACWRASLIQLAEFILGTPPHLYPGEAGKGLRLGFKFTCAQPMGHSVQSSSHFYIWDALGKPPSMLHCRMGLGGWWKGRSRLPRPGPSLGMCLSLTE